eukprot:TRINITY_DN30099_c0_g1_i1.p1 TRINITY_DN30099_c0_g1~~TRINITY_DN30099_c0_g1_i1.p1  ORF type:complete len:194 (-),score=26.07 TRINITY_DN30099_c0_g1_i1:353-934(-)
MAVPLPIGASPFFPLPPTRTCATHTVLRKALPLQSRVLHQESFAKASSLALPLAKRRTQRSQRRRGSSSLSSPSTSASRDHSETTAAGSCASRLSSLQPESPRNLDFQTPTSRRASSPVNVENWQAVGRRMARIFQDLSPTSPSCSGDAVGYDAGLADCEDRMPSVQVLSPTSRLEGGAFAIRLLENYGFFED